MNDAGILYLVGTPIGNLEDMTFRAIATLKQVDLIAAEDTRHTGKLLHHFGIDTPQTSYHEHNAHKRVPELVEKLLQGMTIALVTDAGMPAISDPGVELVQGCIASGVKVIPIPVVTAGIAALTVSGFATQHFGFDGFLPIDKKERRDRLEILRLETRTMILYEAPHRLLRTLEDLAESFGKNRRIAIARELTKLHEEFWRGSIAGAIDYFTDRAPKGEFTLVIEGAEPSFKKSWTEEIIIKELQNLIDSGISRSEASRQLAELAELPRRQIYQLALTLP
ncbi:MULTISPECIES: 16S rRNA (cytidine(1402)-2'-O)-methyltransferase [Pseudanabaena]|uniref:Ribosomal RNA small subunit methyltransferase I n=2 Tax=Pseudanabaena TaxID=1152 RepID=L8N0A9_9CYAN|nr:MULTISPECIES: 16S rRNA (cytidine(1402)-2'-O)-methyltransferase [Pseudanabaena]ELS33161.1 Ribosomal RNA small subunit methyltransferase I [Pseudanabaena biceps PCC 7429]MDG3494637.1 16S rRNA (cytidine(1402)-2'-O)-methyltransferase [Pseudanabaena catenata USMAC16]